MMVLQQVFRSRAITAITCDHGDSLAPTKPWSQSHRLFEPVYRWRPAAWAYGATGNNKSCYFMP